jgi:hypothetical protein
LDLLTYSIYIFVSLTRLFLNLYTAHSDVGGTELFTKKLSKSSSKYGLGIRNLRSGIRK